MYSDPKKEVETLGEIVADAGCPIAAMKGFIAAYNAGEPIPMPIQHWIARALSLWANEGEPIEKSLGLKDDRGKLSEWKKQELSLQKEFVLIDMELAIRAFGVNAEYAAYMVECKRQEESERGDLENRYVYSQDTLIRYWYASTNTHKPKADDRQTDIEVFGEVITDWLNPKVRREYQEMFPRHCWPSEN